MQACVSFYDTVLYILPLSYQWKILHGCLDIAWLTIDVPMKICGPAEFEKWYYIIAIMYLMFAMCTWVAYVMSTVCVWTHMHTHTHTYFLENSHFCNLMWAYFILLSV